MQHPLSELAYMRRLANQNEGAGNLCLPLTNNKEQP
jgi:hypothetical protein